MKSLFVSLVFVGCSLVSFAQKKNCSMLHEGLFRLPDEKSGTTVIKRSKNLQVEENETLGVKMIFYVKWVNSCTYELRVKSVVKGDPALAGKKGNFMTVKITGIKEKSYTTVTTSNFADFRLESEIEIL